MQQSNPTSPSPSEHKQTFREQVIELFKFIIIALIFVIPFRVFIAQPFQVSGASMIDTFHDADYLIVDEISYRFRDPVRGEVIVFNNDITQKNFIKRIIGLPGEKIIISEDQVTVYNDEFPDGVVLTEPYIGTMHTQGTVSVSLDDSQYFVMGDNRENSLDSRSIGPIHRQDIVGRAWLRLLPIHDLSHLPGHYDYLYE